MKIILTTPLFPPEIAEPAPYVKELAKKLSKKHDIRILTYANQTEKVAGVQIINIKKNQHLLGRLFNFTKTLYQNAKEADIIYTQNAIAVSLPVVIVKTLRKIPIIIRYSEDEALNRSRQLKFSQQNLEEFTQKPKTSLKIKFIQKLAIFILRKANYVLTSSNLFSEITQKYYQVQKEKIIKIYNPAPAKKILPFADKPIPYQITAFNENNITEIIKTVKTLASNFPQIKLYVIGKNKEQKKINQTCQDLNLKNKVKFLYSISEAEKEFIKRTSHLLIANNKTEDKTDTIISCFRDGIPTISTKHELINNSTNGIIVEKFSSKILSEKISQLFENENLPKQITKNSKTEFDNKYNWNNHIKRLEDVFSITKNHV